VDQASGDLVEKFRHGQQELDDELAKFVFQTAAGEPTRFPPSNGEHQSRVADRVRQEWRPLGVQRGEIVRTIRWARRGGEGLNDHRARTKVTHSSESLKSAETSSETTDTTKSSPMSLMKPLRRQSGTSIRKWKAATRRGLAYRREDERWLLE